ncbi:hypothetical protein KC19_11G039000 [Ceratodon purpureus]|uniref:Uncharacterized protein n=1 Tax=Ceratodon purpureus TaxID=3225 RepID=A0A8T0GCN1_CERPU|nr:hypothetical protein KC19_11G039000 [Ceratodon purpureus]
MRDEQLLENDNIKVRIDIKDIISMAIRIAKQGFIAFSSFQACDTEYTTIIFTKVILPPSRPRDKFLLHPQRLRQSLSFAMLHPTERERTNIPADSMRRNSPNFGTVCAASSRTVAACTADS